MFKAIVPRYILTITLISVACYPTHFVEGQTRNILSSALQERMKSSIQAEEFLVRFAQLSGELRRKLETSRIDVNIVSVNPTSATTFTSAFVDDIRNLLVVRYSSVYRESTGKWVDSLVSSWISQKAYIATLKWQIAYQQQLFSVSTIALFDKEGDLLFDPLVASLVSTVSTVSSFQTSITTINPRDTKSAEAYERVSSLLGSVTLHWKVTATSEVSPYIAPITNDGRFDISTNEISTWKTDPSGIPPTGDPVVFFGTNGTIDNTNGPYESPITIGGTVDHFHAGTYTSTVQDGGGKSWQVSFSVSYGPAGISISPPFDDSDPIVLGAPNTSGRQINILDKVYSGGILVGRYRGVFWNGGSLTFNNFVLRVEQGGTENGTLSVTIPMQCAYTWWDVVPVLQYRGLGGNILLNVQYVRGHKIPDPICTMTATNYTVDVGQQTTVTVRVSNPSTAVDMESGSVDLSSSSLDGKLIIIGSATKSLGTIPAGQYKDYSFTLQGSTSGFARPQATVSGRWGWPAGDAGKTFSVPTSLDQNIEVRAVDAVTISSGPSGNPNPVESGGTGSSTVTATDSRGHTLSYLWSINGFTVPNSNTRTPSWTAPTNTSNNTQYYNVSVTVTCTGGKSTQGSYQQGVSPVADAVTITSGPSGSPNPVASAGQVNCSVSASDSRGHNLSYSWSAPTGSFSNPNVQNPTWTAPQNSTDQTQNYTISVNVTCTGGQSKFSSYQQGVSPITDAVTITSGPSGSPNPVASGGQVNCTVSASDSREHNLSYSWSAPTGSFSNPNVQNPTWTAPQNSTDQTQNYTISVTVTCTGGQSKSSSYQQGVSPITDAVTITSGPSGSPNPVASGGQVNCTVSASDSREHNLSYSWSAPTGSFSNPNVQNPTWTAQQNSTDQTQNYTISVTVTCTGGQSKQGLYQQGVNKVTGVEHIIIGAIPTDFVLYQNYPNPFNPSTTIEFGIPYSCFVDVTIFNLSGNKVVTLISKTLSAGFYRTIWNFNRSGSGVYFYRLRTDLYVTTKKLLLLK